MSWCVECLEWAIRPRKVPSPSKVAGDMNSNDLTADAVFSYCSRVVKATARWTMAKLGRSGRRVERRTDARGEVAQRTVCRFAVS